MNQNNRSSFTGNSIEDVTIFPVIYISFFGSLKIFLSCSIIYNSIYNIHAGNSSSSDADYFFQIPVHRNSSLKFMILLL